MIVVDADVFVAALADEPRENLTIYDAAYVALAEALGVTLVTADRRIAAAPSTGCPVEIMG